jgi:hypothetical protein
MLLGSKTREKIKNKFNISYLKNDDGGDDGGEHDKPPTIMDDYNAEQDYTDTRDTSLRSIKINSKESFQLPSPYIFAHDLEQKGDASLDLSFLNTNSPPQTLHGKKINLCIFNVQQTPKPYLSYLLYKYAQEDDMQEMLVFPFFKSTNDNQPIVNIAREKISKIFNNWGADIDYKGYLDTENDDVYLFFENKFIQEILFNQKRNDTWWWAVVDELINLKEVLNFPISNSVTTFILHYPLLVILFDENNIKIETPMIGFHGSYYKKITFISIFGLLRAGITASMGPYYYFANYKRVGRYALWALTNDKDNEDIKIVDDDRRFDRGGIVRFVLFLGKTKFFLNHPSDPKDSSKKNNDTEYINSTLRQRDVDGKWTKQHQSVFVSEIMIYLKNVNYTIAPQMVIKDYLQQVPLSYHYVDTEQVKDNNFNEFDTFYIE